MKSASQGSRAFSLVEVVVALAIVLILAAIAVPAMRRAVENSHAARCAAKLRQIGIGLRLATNEQLGVMPRSAWGATTAATDGTANWKWMDAIHPYLGRADLFLCPADAGAAYRPAPDLRPGETSTAYGSYGLNGAYRDAGDSQTPPRSAAYTVTWGMVEDPAGTVWVGDTANRQEANGSFGFTWAGAAAHPPVTGSPRQLDKLVERHGGRANVVFCDGHVETVPLSVLAQTVSTADRVTGAVRTVMPRFTIERE